MNVLGLLQNWVFVRTLSHDWCAVATSSTTLLQTDWFVLLLLDLQAGPSKPDLAPLFLGSGRLILKPQQKKRSPDCRDLTGSAVKSLFALYLTEWAIKPTHDCGICGEVESVGRKLLGGSGGNMGWEEMQGKLLRVTKTWEVGIKEGEGSSDNAFNSMWQSSVWRKNKNKKTIRN